MHCLLHIILYVVLSLLFLLCFSKILPWPLTPPMCCCVLSGWWPFLAYAWVLHPGQHDQVPAYPRRGHRHGEGGGRPEVKGSRRDEGSRGPAAGTRGTRYAHPHLAGHNALWEIIILVILLFSLLELKLYILNQEYWLNMESLSSSKEKSSATWGAQYLLFTRRSAYIFKPLTVVQVFYLR